VAAGYLRLDELDERLTVVWSATTAGQLQATESDLPSGLRRAHDRREAAARVRAAARAGLLPHLAAYAAVMLLLVAVWLAVGVSADRWYPWPLWPALGWGIGVVGHVRAATRATPAGGHA
jgi:hypothetical protein